MKAGDRVRIVEDEYPELVGIEGTVGAVSSDGTCSWVMRDSALPQMGVWCANSALEVLTDQPPT